jgi:hypothetical protein
METNFQHFHTHLVLNDTKTRVIDDYGFEYPHDYPNEPDESCVGEGAYKETPGKLIASDWAVHHSAVLAKYGRRIERFLQIMHDPDPIVVLTRHTTSDALKLHEFLTTHFKKPNIFFINTFCEPYENDQVTNIYAEKNGVWNDPAVWSEAIETLKTKIKLL